MKIDYKILSIAIMGFFYVLIQPAIGITPLVDITYQLSNAYRIFLGQIPYKDFDLVLAPGTYFVMAGVMKLFGLNYIYQTISVALMHFFAIILTFYILKSIYKNNLLNYSLSVLLVFTGFAIYPFPIYDMECMLSILVSIFLFQYRERFQSKGNHVYYIIGILSFLPILFKQNVGLVFAPAIIFMLGIRSILNTNHFSWRHFKNILLGFLFAALAFICYLFYHHMVKEYLFQTISFPGEIRNPLKNAFSLVKVYLIHKTSWFMYLPLIALVLPARYKRIAFTILVLLVYFLVPFALYRSAPMTHYAFVWPFIIVLASIGIYKNIKDQNVEKHYLVSPTSPIIMIIVANASFLSQGFVGSSYGIWPVFAILISYCYKNFEEMRTGLAIIIAILTFTLALNSINDSRLSFVDTKGPHTMAESSLLSGLGTNGSWFNDLNEIEQYINTNIPENESIYFIPGEDPLYYLTGRTPKLNYFQLNSITLSRDLDSVYADINMAGIKWVIIKTKLQCERGFINYDLLADSIKNNYVLYRKLDSYEIYRLDGLTEH